VATGSIYGTVSRAWTRYDQSYYSVHGHEAEPPTVGCHILFDEFITLSRIAHVCLGDTVGPLNILSVGTAGAKAPSILPKAPSITAHIRNHGDHFCFVLRRPIRWVIDIQPEAEWFGMYQQIYGIVSGYPQLLKQAYPEREEAETLQIQLYASTPYLGFASPAGGVPVDRLGLDFPNPPTGAMTLEQQREVAVQMSKGSAGCWRDRRDSRTGWTGG
jgi:hypothetical protein